MNVAVKKLGTGVAVVIPKAMARKLGLAVGMKLQLCVRSSGISLRKPGQPVPRPLSEMIREMDRKAYERHNRELLRS